MSDFEPSIVMQRSRLFPMRQETRLDEARLAIHDDGDRPAMSSIAGEGTENQQVVLVHHEAVIGHTRNWLRGLKKTAGMKGSATIMCNSKARAGVVSR